jgi:glycosyltransferase involved in cell wall biosynthesis
MNSDDRLSLIIPAFNAAPFIAQAIESVLAQTYTNIEIVVVDDASTDATRSIAAQFGAQIVLITHDRQQGVSIARNHGVEAATGTWLAFLDADDWLPSTFAEEARPLLNASEALCYDNVIVDDPPSDPPTLMTLHHRATGWNHQRVDKANLHVMFDGAPLLKSIVHRDAFARVGGFDARFRGGEDFHYHVKLIAAGITLSLVEQPHGFYRRHSSQATAATSTGNRQNIVRHLESCREWILMYRCLPQEHSLDTASRRACAQAVRYWQYRFVRASFLATLERRDFGFLTNNDVVHASGGALLDVASRTYRGVIRR